MERLWELVREWRYTGKSVNATEEQLCLDACADRLEAAINESGLAGLITACREVVPCSFCECDDSGAWDRLDIAFRQMEGV